MKSREYTKNLNEDLKTNFLQEISKSEQEIKKQIIKKSLFVLNKDKYSFLSIDLIQ